MSFISDVLGAGASFAMGNPLGAAADLVKGIEGLFGGGNSQQQVQQQLAQLNQALQLPPGTLQNIINSQQSQSPFGMDGGPSGACQQAMNTMQEGSGPSAAMHSDPGMGMNEQAAMQQAMNAVSQGQGEINAGRQTLQALQGQHGNSANVARHAAMNEIRQGSAEKQAGLNEMHHLQHHHHHGEPNRLNQNTQNQLMNTIAPQLERMRMEGQNPFMNGGMA